MDWAKPWKEAFPGEVTGMHVLHTIVKKIKNDTFSKLLLIKSTFFRFCNYKVDLCCSPLCYLRSLSPFVEKNEDCYWGVRKNTED